MKLALILTLAAVVGCEQQHSRLDSVQAQTTGDPASAASPGKAGVATPTGDLESRVRRLEDTYARNAEALDFLNKVYAQQKAQQEEQENSEPAPDAVFAVDVAADVKAGAVDGPPTAYVTIVKAFDFACPYCQRVSPTMDALVKDYAGKVRVVYKNMVVHPQVATPVHLASCAAAKQGKYMAFKTAFWDKGFGAYSASQGKDHSAYTEEGIAKIAGDVGLDTAKLKTDMNSDACKALVKDDMDELEKFKVHSTPSFFINGKSVAGALDENAFKTIIDERLKIAEASGVSGADYYQKEVMGKGEKQFRSKKDPKPN